MTYAIRHGFVVLPLFLILSGCAGPQRTESSYHRRAHRLPRATERSATLVVDRNSPGNEVLPASYLQHDITLDQICKHVQNNTAVVIDARAPADFASGHVRGAINVPAGQIDAFVAQIQQNVSSGDLIIIYCASAWCGSGDMVCEYLATQGYTNLRVFKPGWQLLASAKSLQ